MLGSHAAYFFNQPDLQSVITAAGQIAGAVERASLYTQTDESLRRRVEQLTSITRISRELNTTLELQHLLQRVYDEVLHTTLADCGSILLFELKQAENEALPNPTPNVILHLGDSPASALHPMEAAVLETGETLIVGDFEHPNGDIDGTPTLEPAHAGVRSAMVVPIAYQEQIAGLIHLHARTPNRFDDTAREIAETLAIQAAIALGNAHRYQEQRQRSELLNRRMETLSKLFETSQSLQLELPLEEALENIAYAIQAATPFNTVVISAYDARSKNLHRLTGAGLTLAEIQELRAHPQAWNSLGKILRPEFQISRSYFIPYEEMPVVPPDVHTLTVLPVDPISTNGHASTHWHPEDMLAVPLLNAHGEPLGLISVDAPRDELRPDRPAIETLEIFASQAALVIESQQKLGLLNHRVEALEQRDQPGRPFKRYSPQQPSHAFTQRPGTNPGFAAAQPAHAAHSGRHRHLRDCQPPA